MSEKTRKANLEMTVEDHHTLGSTPPKVLVDNPGKTLAETMDDKALLDFVRNEVETVAELWNRAAKGGERVADFLRVVRDGFLARNLLYLRGIGRLPAEFADLDPATKFASPEKAEVKVIHYPPGISAGCAKCRSIIAKGRFAVGVQVGSHHYLVGNNPPKTCCGEEKKVPLLFDNVSDADMAAQETIGVLNRDGDTSNLRLLEFAQFISTAQH